MKLQFLASIVLAAVARASVEGQSTPPNAAAPAATADGPVPLKRVAPPKNPAPNESVPTLDKYPFTGLINGLENDNPASSTQPKAPTGDGTTDPQNEFGVPKDYDPAKDVPLTGAAKDAVEVSQTWMLAADTPAEGKDGRILYTYGAGL